jgi:hypothetical protein
MRWWRCWARWSGPRRRRLATPGHRAAGGCDGDERLTHQELLSTSFQLIVAGHDTTTSLIGNSVVALFRHPDQLALLRAEPDRIAAALEELLRYDAPVPHSTFRYAVEPVEIAELMCAAGNDRPRWPPPAMTRRGAPSRRRWTSTARTSATSPSVRSTSASGRRWPGWRDSSPGRPLERFPLHFAVPDEEPALGHGDGLVLRGLSELPVIPGPARTVTPAPTPAKDDRHDPQGRRLPRLPSETGYASISAPRWR